MRMSAKPKVDVVVLLAAGESRRPKGMRCVYPYCGRRFARINRDVELVLEDNKGVHWADLPDDVTVFEHKCRGCNYLYRIYTPKTVAAKDETQAMLESKSNV